MFKLLGFLLLGMVLTTPPIEAVASESQEEAVVSLSANGEPFCAGVAIAPHYVLTATHCMAAAWMQGIAVEYDGWACPYDVVVAMDMNDHAIVRTCREWETYVSFSQSVELPALAPIIQYGHPNGSPLMAKAGRYMGRAEIGFRWAKRDSLGYVFDLTGWKGDSGGPIFHDGKLVGTVSAGYSPDDRFHVMVSYPYTFTQDQLKDLGLDD